MDYSDFDPANRKPNFVDKAGNLKPGVTTPLYTSGAPTAANQLKPSLMYPDGTLKPSIANAAGLKASIGSGGGLTGYITANDETPDSDGTLVLSFVETSVEAAISFNDETPDSGGVLIGGITPVVYNYQWGFAGAPLADGGDISGVETSEVTRTNLEEADSGVYYCDVENPISGRVRRFTKQITVNPAPAVTYLDSAFKTAASFYGFRKPFASSGPAFRIRRTDTTTLDTSWTDEGYVDIDEIVAFVGAGDGEIIIAYDLGDLGLDIDLIKTTGPLLIAGGVLNLHDYRACWAFNGTTDAMAKNFALSGTDKATILAGVGGFSSNSDQSIMHTCNSTSAVNGIAVITEAGGALQVGSVGGGYNLWKRDALDPQRTVLGVVMDRANGASTEALPFFNGLVSTVGWTHPYSDDLTGNNANVVGGMGAYWDGAGGALVTPGTPSFDFLAVFPSAASEGDLQTISEFFGAGPELVILGDSTGAAHAGAQAVASYIYTTDAERVSRSGIVDLAVPGHTISQQKTAWTALTQKLVIRNVLVQVGLNDMNPAVATATTIAEYQDLIDTIATDAPQANIIAVAMTPAYERWPALGWDQAAADAKWVATNDAIMGRGGSPITGVDARTEAATIALSYDVSGHAGLAPAHDTGDHVHMPDSGKIIMAAAWAAELI